MYKFGVKMEISGAVIFLRHKPYFHCFVILSLFKIVLLIILTVKCSLSFSKVDLFQVLSNLKKNLKVYKQTDGRRATYDQNRYIKLAVQVGQESTMCKYSYFQRLT